MFRLEFETENAAFDDTEHALRADETARILRAIAAKIEGQGAFTEALSGVVYDVNGNRVGEWSLDAFEREEEETEPEDDDSEEDDEDDEDAISDKLYNFQKEAAEEAGNADLAMQADFQEFCANMIGNATPAQAAESWGRRG